MKIKYFFILLFIGFKLSIAQEIIIKGRVVSNEKKAIEGVLIVIKDNIIAYTLGDGSYSFSLSKPELKNQVNFYHLSFEDKSYKLEDLLSNSIIELKEKIIALDEVIINNMKPLTQKEIVKKSVKQFTHKIRHKPYWASFNLKYVLFHNDTVKKYKEAEGKTYQLGVNNNPWFNPVFVPEKERNTVFNLSDVYTKNYIDRLKKFEQSNFFETINRNIGAYIQQYRFFEQIHPLSKRGYRQLNYSISRTDYLNGEECYIINFKQKNKITISNSSVNFMRGQLWISTNSFNLKKLLVSFKFNSGLDNIFTINYTELNNTLYASYLYYNSKLESSELRVKGEISFKQIDNISLKPIADYHSFKDIKYRIPTYIIIPSIICRYDSENWTSNEIFKNIFSKEIKILTAKTGIEKSFNEGASQMNKWYEEFKKELNLNDHMEILKIIKNDLN
jgi:hypothetical protein